MKDVLYDLDQEIMRVWTTVEDLDLILENVCNEAASTDDIANALLGIRTLLDMRCEKMYNIYSKILMEQNGQRLQRLPEFMDKPLPF